MKKLLVLIALLFTINSTALSDSRTYSEKKCLAETIYRESRGEPYRGQLAVGQVVLNRVKHKVYPGTICEVVFQKYQFEWTKKFKQFKAPENFMYLADLVLSGKHELSSFKATHFHATYVNPKWNLRKLEQIGNHIFYTL